MFVWLCLGECQRLSVLCLFFETASVVFWLCLLYGIFSVSYVKRTTTVTDPSLCQ